MRPASQTQQAQQGWEKPVTEQTPVTPENTIEERKGEPLIDGMLKHANEAGGFAVWLPMGWTKVKMSKGHRGNVFFPEADKPDTYFSAELYRLKFKVSEDDVPVLREGFNAGLQALPEIQIESQDEIVTNTLITFEARYTFSEGTAQRKRWLRNIYWGRGQIVFIAQGATAAEFNYWLPMFYQAMVTFEM
jgi:hypothetical protein